MNPRFEDLKIGLVVEFIEVTAVTGYRQITSLHAKRDAEIS